MRLFYILLFLVFCLQGCAPKQESESELKSTEYLPEEHISSNYNTENEDESGLSWEEEKIILPTLGKNYEVWFIADSHIVLTDEEDSEQIKEYASQRQAVFQNDNSVDAAYMFAEFIRLANEKQPDLLVFGGDIIDFPSHANLAFLEEQLNKLDVPFIYVMGNHDWTFPWEYMTQEGSLKYRPLIEEITGMNTYAQAVEWDDILFLGIDNSSNQVAPEALPMIEEAVSGTKPVILIQHVPFSTENLIQRAKQDWANPVTLGMQIHGGIPVNETSSRLYSEVLRDETKIELILAGHVHFSYQENLGETTIQLISDAAFHGKAVRILLSGNR